MSAEQEQPLSEAELSELRTSLADAGLLHLYQDLSGDPAAVRAHLEVEGELEAKTDTLFRASPMRPNKAADAAKGDSYG